MNLYKAYCNRCYSSFYSDKIKRSMAYSLKILLMELKENPNDNDIKIITQQVSFLEYVLIERATMRDHVEIYLFLGSTRYKNFRSNEVVPERTFSIHTYPKFVKRSRKERASMNAMFRGSERDDSLINYKYTPPVIKKRMWIKLGSIHK